MLEGNKKDISKRRLKSSMVSLVSQKVRVLIIGAQDAGILKARHFLKQGFEVYMIADKYPDKSLDKNIIFKKMKYEKGIIYDKHIVIICISDDILRKKIVSDLESLSKLYIDCTDYTNGNALLPAQTNTESVLLGINTFYGNPKGSLFVLNKIKQDIKKYDLFIEYTSIIRDRVKNNISIKKDVLNFLYTDDFYHFFVEGKSDIVLKMFYGDELQN